jgi:hypothetical protein
MNKNKLKYHKKWFEYNFINEEILANQIIEFNKGEDIHSEHYRYRSFLNYIEEQEKFEDKDIINFISLVELDDDQMMSSDALAKLFGSEKLTSSQIIIISEKLITYGNWAKKIVERRI